MTATVHETLDELRVPIDSLQTYPRNPRRGSTAAIRESLEAHGQYRPLVVNRRTSDVLAGNHTYLAALELGWAEVAVTYVDVDEEQAAKIVLVDNRTADLAYYDDRELVDLLQSLDDVTGTGYADDDLDALLRSIDVEQPEEPERERYTFGVYDRERVIDAAVDWLHEHGFPYRALPLHVCLTEINDLASTIDSKLVSTRLGYGVADTYHPHRWHARVGTARNALDVLGDERLLRVALGHLLTYGLGWDSGIPSVLALTRGAQAVSNFRPGFALSLLRRFAPENGTVLDTSTGYGGRLVGFLASSCALYIGIDPARETHKANERIVDALCPESKAVRLHCQPAEDVDPSLLSSSCDFAFTSPPYFAKERYTDETTQSWKRYGNPLDWRDGFLVPMLALQHEALKPGCTNVVNIADVKVGSEHVPLVDWTLAAARDVGFEIVDVEQLPLGHRWGPVTDDVVSEPVIVMRKP